MHDRARWELLSDIQLIISHPFIAMDIRPGLNRIEMPDVEAARRHVDEAGYTPFVLAGEYIVDRVSFFDAIRATFPLDPPLISYYSWDALSDSLWEGLYRHPAQRIAILWVGTEHMVRLAPADFDIPNTSSNSSSTSRK